MFTIELEGETRHLSKREQACDALAAAAALAPRINAMTFSGTSSELHRSVNRAHIGVLHAGLSKAFHEWRPPQVADCAKLLGTARYAPSQSRASVLADLQQMVDALVLEFPGLKGTLTAQDEDPNRPNMPPFEVAQDSRIVTTINHAYQQIRGQPQPTGAIRPPAFYGTDAAHLAAPLDGRPGIEGLVCGPGGEFNTMPDEKVRISDFIDCVRFHLFVHRVCGHAIHSGRTPFHQADSCTKPQSHQSSRQSWPNCRPYSYNAIAAAVAALKLCGKP